MLSALFPVRSALLIDYDNIRSLNGTFARRVPNWYNWCEDGRYDGDRPRKRKFVRKIAYWHPVNGGQEREFTAKGFEGKTCIYTAGSKRDSSAVDLYLAIDAVELASSRNPPEEVVILATDSDYFPVIELLKRKKIRSVIVVSSRDASYKYEGHADIVITAEDLAEACEYERPRRFFWPRRAPKAKVVDIAFVADAVAKAALALDGPITVNNLVKMLKDMPGFTKTGEASFFGFGSLNQLAREIVRRKPELRMWRNERGVVIAPKQRRSAPPPQGMPRASPT
jgi:uncharacterized LabA/DUF88 family protein